LFMFKFIERKRERARRRANAYFVGKTIFQNDELEQLLQMPRNLEGQFMINDKPFLFHDGLSFYATYKEIITTQIYAFNNTSEKPFIIDCGANMGLSVYFFATAYPIATIIAFEPEDAIYKVLEKNKNTFNLQNVTLHKKAVWDSETVLQFYTDNGMGGTVENKYSNQKPTEIETLRLANFLEKKVDMLKMDIEGAEYTVLQDCIPFLKNVENIFIEYHSFIDKEQHLEDILQILKTNGYRYHLKESFSRQRPFADTNLACETMDMAINIFAYRN
jgi:FkbM family methyltransferase